MAEGSRSGLSAYANPRDLQECRRIHRKFGTTYYFASRGFPPETRRRVDALYGFVRVPDELVDGPVASSIDEASRAIEAYRTEFLGGLSGARPQQPVLRAFCDLMGEVQIPLEEPLLFLRAMESDLTVNRYATYEELRGYMRGSAAAVGVMMCYVLAAGECEATFEAAKSLGEAMQLTNFLRDIAEDAARGRVYLPKEDLDAHGLSYEDIFDAKVSEKFRNLMRFEIERARNLYALADQGIPKLPPSARTSVTLARVLYGRILDRIEDRDYDVFRGRARTSRLEKIAVAGRLWVQRQR